MSDTVKTIPIPILSNVIEPEAPETLACYVSVA